jgi:hypothetical protein
MTEHRDEPDVLVTHTEWQALLLGSRALREVGEGLRRAGAAELARESDRNADALQRLGERAVVLPAHDRADAAYGMYEALTDPLDAAMREREAEVTGVLEPSDSELSAELAEVSQELGLRPSAPAPEPEAER